MQYKILVYQNGNCEDLIAYLRLNNYIVIETTKDDALEKLERLNFDMAILDSLEIPSRPKDGEFALVKALRWSSAIIGILFIQSKFNEATMRDALAAGADNYVAKPYSLRAVHYYIQAMLRRTGQLTKDGVYTIGKFTLDPLTHTLMSDTQYFHLQHLEFQVLRILINNRNALVEKTFIVQTLWGDDNYFNSRCLDVILVYLRKYLKDDPSIKIETIRRKGYILRA